MISTLAAILLLLAMALCLVLIPFVLWLIRVMLRLASQRIEAPSAAFSCGETKEYEAEQHRGLAAIGQRIEALRGMTNEMSEGHLAVENEGGDARKQAKEKKRAGD